MLAKSLLVRNYTILRNCSIFKKSFPHKLKQYCVIQRNCSRPRVSSVVSYTNHKLKLYEICRFQIAPISFTIRLCQSCKPANKYRAEREIISPNLKSDLKPKSSQKNPNVKLGLNKVHGYCSYAVKIKLLYLLLIKYVAIMTTV